MAFFQIDCDVLLLDEVLNSIFVGVFSKNCNIKLIIPAILVNFFLNVSAFIFIEMLSDGTESACFPRMSPNGSKLVCHG